MCLQGPGDEPVWEQLLHGYLNDSDADDYSDAEVAQEVDAGLADMRLE